MSAGDPTERHARRKRIFFDALELPGSGREEFLRGACSGDDELLREIREMIAVETGDSEFLDSGVSTVASGVAMPEAIGPFRILGLLGEGGMGAVYEAEQSQPRRSVALKVLHADLATPRMLRRFDLESEVLGRLQHPGIARIYAAGTSDVGRGPQPWFAMEVVEGEPLTDYCTRRSLSLDERLELVAKVADAVQHAHQRGVVHRDLKPGNILVDAHGQPKVLDFGIARANDDELPRATLQTDPRMIVGTLQYMSPEQASADPDAIDVRTDVYSLGVILYELAAGRPPLALHEVPMHEALRRILEDEPRPLRQCAPRVPRDVSVIAHAALAKDKEQRYSSSAELAADLRRFLAKEPIAAQAPTAAYRLSRFAARNKSLVGGVIAVVVALALGLGIAIWQRNQAREAAARAEAINRFLLSDLLASPSPERLGRDVRVVDVLAPALRSAERAFAEQPRIAADVLDAIGASYRSLGLAADAEPLTRRALALVGENATDRLALRIRGNLVAVQTELDSAEAAVPIAEALVADSVRALGADDPDTLEHRVELANALRGAGEYERSTAEMRSVVADQARVLGDDDSRTLLTRSHLAMDLAVSGAVTEARELLEATLARQQDALGPAHPGTLYSRSYLGWILTLGGDWEVAERHYADLVPVLEEVYGSDHPYTALARVEWAQCPLRLGRADEAEAAIRAGIADLTRRLGADHSWTLKAERILSDALSRMGRHRDAIAVARGIVNKRRSVSPASEELGHALSSLGRSHQDAGELRDAAAVFRETVEIYRGAFDEPNDFLAQALYNLGVVLRDDGDFEGAVAPLEEALAIDRRVWGDEHSHVASDRYNLARALVGAGRTESAVRQIGVALAIGEQLEFSESRMLAYSELLGQAHIAGGRVDEGARLLRQVVGGLESIGEGDSPTAVRARETLARVGDRSPDPEGSAGRDSTPR